MNGSKDFMDAPRINVFRLLVSGGYPLRRSRRVPERWLSALPDRGILLMLQKNPECEAVSNEEQRHDQSWNEVSRSQLPWRKPAGIGLVKGVHEIDRAPDVEDPRDE